MAVTYAATGLVSGTEYFYTFRAGNAATNLWASPGASFTAVAAPTIENGVGAMVRKADATLRGELTTGGLGDVTVYWGLSDGGTNHTTWDHTNAVGDVLQGAFETDAGAPVLYGLTYYYRCYATNSVGQDWSGVMAFESLSPKTDGIEAGTVSVGDTWTTVDLDYVYDSAVVVCAVNYSANTVPVLARIRNVGMTSFDVKLQNPGDLAAVVPETVHYLVMEEGTNQLPDGRRIEAQRVLSDGLSSKAAGWATNQLERITYGQTYTAPVVLGQVMTANDPNWSAFWSTGGAANPPDSANCYVGKHVGEDTNAVRVAETLGVIIVEAGAGTLDGVAYEAGVGAATIEGVGNAPPYFYPLTAFSSAPEVGVVCQTDMNGADGGWVNLFGSAPLTSTSMALTVDEDQVGDNDRGHLAEPAAYWVFESALVHGQDLTITNLPPTAVTSNSATLRAELYNPLSVFDVSVYWGMADGGTNAGAWANTNRLGWYTNGTPFDIGFAVTGLVARTNYYYTFLASNQAETVTAAPSMLFSTLDEPIVENRAVTDVVAGRATLNGELVAGGSADVTIYWGTSDGGMNAETWDYANPLGELINGTFAGGTTNPALYGGVYYYRCYATNAFGDDWADAPVQFTTPRPPSAGGAYFEWDAAQDAVGDNTWDSTTANAYSWTFGSAQTPVDVLDARLGSLSKSYAFNAARATGASFHSVTNDASNEDATFEFVLDTDTPDGIIWLSGGNGTGSQLDMHGGNLRLHVKPGGTPITIEAGLDATDSNRFIHVVGVIDLRDEMALYIDGMLADRASLVGVNDWSGTDGGGIGRLNGTSPSEGSVSGTETNDFIGNIAWARYYRRALSASEVLANFDALRTDYNIRNRTVADVSTNAATFNGMLYADGAMFDVYVHWGTNAAALANTNYVGHYEDAVSTSVSYEVTTLLPGTEYHYTFHASNAATTITAVPNESFWTIGQPAVSNAPVSDLMANSVTLNGTLSATYSADVTVYWGLTDGETTPSAWSNASSLGTVMLGAFSTNESVLAGGMYYYRCYATNSAGEAWADSTGTFTTPLAAVSIADATVVEGDAGTLDAVFAVTLSGPSVSNVTVGYAASSGSAMEGADFAATNGVLSIPAGQTNAQIAVTVNADTEYEYSGETFSVRLSGPAGCTIADGTATGTIVDDDLPEHLARLSSRMKITLDEYAGSETLTNFPVLLRFGDGIPRFNYSTFTSDDGLDLTFTDGGRSFPLNYEIESWDTNGESCVWVQVPELPPGGTHIWAFWGDDSLYSTGISNATDITGCVLWLKADEGVVTNGSSVASWLDQSGQGHDLSQLTVSNQPLFVQNVVGGKPVVRFDTNNQYLTRGDALGFTGNAAMSVFMVIEADDGALRRALHLGNTNGANGQSIAFATDSSFRYNNGNRIFANDPMNGAFGIGAWRTEADEPYGEGRFFKNGDEKGQTGSTNPGNLKNLADGETLVGQGRGNNTTFNDRFLGDIAEIIVYDRALSNVELNQVGYYLEQKYGLTTDYGDPSVTTVPQPFADAGTAWTEDFEAVWHMTETDARDSTDHFRRGAAAGAPTVQDGQIAGSVNFVEANGDQVAITGYKGVLGTSPRTLSAWIKTTNGAADSDLSVLSWGTDAAGQKWILRVQATNGTNGAIRVEVNSGYNVGMTPVNDDQWHYVVATFTNDGTPSAEDVLLYVDGAFDGSSAPLPQAINTTTGIDVRIGSGHADRRFNGPIDEARISSVVRSPDWIRACYDNQKRGSAFARYSDVRIPGGTLLLVR